MMKRFPTYLALLLLLASAVGLRLAVAQGSGFDPAGKYERVQPPQPTETGDKVEVVDVFWYGCPHCFKFLPSMEQFEKGKPDYVTIRRMPAIFRENWENHARAFYTAQVLGIADKVHRPIFEAIHEGNRRLETREELAAFFEGFGVSGDEFDATFNSFAVETLMRKSKVMQQRYGVRGTPSVIVNGKYRVSGSLAGSYPNVIKVVEALAAQENQSKVSSQ
jgi:thiol:disulfide interchange protein DsbA